jgi:hypothetical protein
MGLRSGVKNTFSGQPLEQWVNQTVSTIMIQGLLPRTSGGFDLKINKISIVKLR